LNLVSFLLPSHQSFFVFFTKIFLLLPPGSCRPFFTFLYPFHLGRPTRETTAPKYKQPETLPKNGLNKTGLEKKGDKTKPPPPKSTGKTNAKGPKKGTKTKLPKQDKSDSEDDENGEDDAYDDEDEEQDEDEDDVEDAGNDLRIRDSQKHTESTSIQKHKKKKNVAREDFIPETQVSSDDSASGSTSGGGTM
jgi:hypothetical protein